MPSNKSVVKGPKAKNPSVKDHLELKHVIGRHLRKEIILKMANTKKTVVEKETTKKAVKAEKPAKEKKAAVKKTVKAEKPAVEKKAPAKKAAVAKMSVQDYMDKINWKKGEAQFAGNLYIEIAASELLNEFEAGISNMTTVKKAVKECLLIGDEILTSTKTDLTVRYYVDNLSPERAKYSA